MHLRPAFSVARAQLGLDGFAWTGGQRQGLLCLIPTAKPQDHGPGAPILGPRVSDHGALVLVL
jgi:hypothetical protein